MGRDTVGTQLRHNRDTVGTRTEYTLGHSWGTNRVSVWAQTEYQLGVQSGLGARTEYTLGHSWGTNRVSVGGKVGTRGHVPSIRWGTVGARVEFQMGVKLGLGGTYRVYVGAQLGHEQSISWG